MSGVWFSVLVVLEFLVHDCGRTFGASFGYQSPPLPPYEVVAINELLISAKQPWDNDYKDFSASDCGRRGVGCINDDNSNTSHITEIDFSNHGLSGQIPEEIGNLSSLNILYLYGNKLNGHIPDSFSKLLNLTRLILTGNHLEGPIPQFIAKLTSLTALSLEDNLFNGSIPDKLGNLRSLEYLNLGRNMLSGNIPHQLGSITNLSSLYLFDNQLSGPLPTELGNLLNLKYLGIDNNILSGPLPPSFKDLRKMMHFNLRGNKFTGKVPEAIGNWKNLDTLNLLGNKFEGPLPREISTLTKLTFLGVSDLNATTREEGLFPNLSGMTKLEHLTLRNCQIKDKIPDYIVNMQSLDYLDLSFNNLAGEFPFRQGQTTRYIFLRGNKLSGSLPEWLLTKNYTYVDVSENNFILTKPPPSARISNKTLNLFQCTNTTSNTTEKYQLHPYMCENNIMQSNLFINCGGEKTLANGSTYEADMEPNGGATFFLSEKRTWGYSSMGKFMYTYQDLFLANRTCNMSMDDSSLYTSARLAPLSLKYYGFCLKNGNYTVTLYFAEIILNPDHGLESKDRRLFDIEIQGEKVETDFNIAERAGGVNKNTTSVHTVVVNNSRLEIHLFWTGMGTTSGPTSNYGPLISAISASRVEKKQSRLPPLAISAIVGASLFLPLLVLLILWRRGYLGAKDPELEDIKAELQGKFFNFQQLKAATQNFSNDNKLGEGRFGSVFKGILSDGTAIAVKRFSARSMQGIREFVNEIGTVSALLHPNLVKLLGCCAENSQRLLVYEYMECNSLEHALFGSQELKKRLDWATRVKICHGIAKGLAFLHEESELKVVHRDIKPTNILLDKDLTPKISDFGFAKFYEGEATHIITRTTAGTTGYMAPEYATRGHLTYKADVYSFGVVVLEIVSGKNSASYLPNDQSEYLLDSALVLQKEGNIMELVDSALEEDYSWDEANTILNLAMLCTDQSYTLRPKMSEVVKILDGLSQTTHSGSTSYGGISGKEISST